MMEPPVVTLLKFGLIALLLWWMIDSDKLDLRTTALLFENPSILLAGCSLWLCGTVLMTSYRWKLLVNGMKLSLSYPRAISLSLVGFFFSSVMPGAVGGDLIKAFYVYRDHPGSSKTPALLSLILDRILGLYAIVSISVLGLPWTIRIIDTYPALTPVLVTLLSLFVGMSAFFVAVLLPSQRWHRFLQLVFEKIGSRILLNIYLALRMYRERPFYLLAPCLLSIVFQVACMAFYALVTSHFVGENLEFALFTAVVPLGIVASTLPIAPGGLGVGHAAFGELFHLVGIDQGANIFNLVFVSQMSLNLLGFIPYLALKKKPKTKQHLSKEVTSS